MVATAIISCYFLIGIIFWFVASYLEHKKNPINYKVNEELRFSIMFFSVFLWPFILFILFVFFMQELPKKIFKKFNL